MATSAPAWRRSCRRLGSNEPRFPDARDAGAWRLAIDVSMRVNGRRCRRVRACATNSASHRGGMAQHRFAVPRHRDQAAILPKRPLLK